MDGSCWTEHIDSPIGPVCVVASCTGVREVRLAGRDTGPGPSGGETASAARDIARDAARQLAGYFSGRRWHFEVPLDITGTPFQREAWAVLSMIPPGRTITYGEQARRLGRPGAARAVGGANGSNPVPILVPCHRVVAAGSQGGYAGGTAAKAWLLRHELAAGAAAPERTAQTAARIS